MKYVIKKSEKIALSSEAGEAEICSKNGLELLTSTRQKGRGRTRYLPFGAFATVFVALASILIFYGCKKETDLQSENIKMQKSMYQQPTQIVDINTFIMIDGVEYSVVGTAVAGSYNGQIYECNVRWTMQVEGAVAGIPIILNAILKPEFANEVDFVPPVRDNYIITVTNPSMITEERIFALWNRIVEECEAKVVIIDMELINISNDFSSIDISRIGREDGMLIFESLEHYAQTIDALVEICEQYSNNYTIALEEKLGCSIDDANEEIVSAILIANNFFPYNPLIEFIELIGFANSAYPMLREREIEWLANDELFFTQPNPFDAVSAGYVQSALHNTEGVVKIRKDVDEDEDEVVVGKPGQKSNIGFTVDLGNKCDGLKSSKEKCRSASFRHSSKDREVRATLATTSINIRGKTVAYVKHGAKQPWVLWWVRVDVDFGGAKVRKCDDENTVSGGDRGYALAGLVEKYYTFSHTPTYIIPSSEARITGTHWSKHGGTVNTAISNNN